MKNAMVQVRTQKKAGSKLLWNLPSIIYAKLLFDFNILGSLCLLLRSKLWNPQKKMCNLVTNLKINA